MKVVCSGKTSKTVICNDCNATLKYTKTDISYSDGYKEVRCPECGHFIKVGKTMI